MTKPDVSVIIPSRDCEFVSKTVDDLFSKASGPIEVDRYCWLLFLYGVN